jgi:4-hydroxybenzoate polyprenyltransferase
MAAGVIPQGGSNATTAVIVAPPTTLLEVLPDPKLLGLFTVGAFVMRGAGCTINDMWDRDLDNQVARTKTRPLAAGILTPTQAVGWLAVQLSAGLGVLVSLPHTEYCFWWGAASLPLVVAYPLMKRFFDYPQLVLGVCFNWGAFMGWAAVHGGMDYNVVLPLYASGVAWTIGYDTLYAHQDKEDDAKLGLKSTAITFGKFGSSSSNGENGDDDDESRHKRVLYGLAATTYACWLLAGYNDFVGTIAPTTTMTGQLLPFGGVGAYALGVTGAYAHLVWQIRTADLNDPHNLAERFRSNAKVGGIVFGSILAGKMAMLA